MRMSEEGRQKLIERNEGLRLRAYQDSAGVWTIGYGHTSAAGEPLVRPGLSLSTRQASDILIKDLLGVEREMTRMTAGAKDQITQKEFDALCSWAFNVGTSAARDSTLMKLLLKGDKLGAAEQFLRWNRGGGRVLAGLVRRRKEERFWFLFGRLPDGTTFDPQPTAQPSHPDPWYTRLWNRIKLSPLIVVLLVMGISGCAKDGAGIAWELLRKGSDFGSSK